MTVWRLVRGGALFVALPLVLLVLAHSPCAAEGLIPRSEMLSIDEIRPGMKGVGKSVFQGTKVESFGLTVLGVLRRVQFDGDMILVRIDSGPPVTEGYGVVSGMSGSPVYVGGKLIGAIAYAWTFAEKPIAGVTPIAQMVESFRPGSASVRMSGTLRATEPFVIDGERIERAVVARSASDAASRRGPHTAALVPVATPVLVSGLDPDTISLLRTALEPVGLVPLAGSGSRRNVDTEIVPGQAVGARLIEGDLDVTAIGTVTYVKDDVVLAFGHPMSSLGTTDLPLVAAHVHGVMPSAYVSFKFASAGQTLGHFTEDRPWCLGGRLGGEPKLIETSLRITDADRGVARAYGLRVIRNRSLTSLLLTAALAGAVRSVGPPTEGTTRVRFSIDAEGLPRMERENTYAMEGRGGLLRLLLGPMAGVESATQELSQILDVLQNSEFGEASLNRVEVGVELSKRRRVARLEEVYIPRHSVEAGDQVEAAIVLRTANGGVVTRRETIEIPATCPPGRVRVGVAGGRSAEGTRARLDIAYPTAQSMAQMVAQMLDRPGNDELVIELALPTVGIEARGFAFRDLPPPALALLRAATATRLRPLRDHVEWRRKTEWVISGDTVLTLTVDGREKDKAGRPPSSRYHPPRFRQTAPGLADIFFGLDASAARAGVLWGFRAGEEEEVDLEAPPAMPSWEEVETVDEREITLPALSDRPRPTVAERGDAIGRVASIWRLSTYEELAKGEVEGAALLSTGGLTLAPEARVLAQIEARCLWPIAVAPDGCVYTGSWADGCLRRTTPEGETEVVLETEDAAVQAIAVAADGTVYAGAVPSGTIHRLATGTAPEPFCRLDAQNIWALVVSKAGDVWAATGPEGRLFRISPNGAAQVAFTAADRHIVGLALGADDTLYLGTSPLGKVYAVSSDGTARSVCELREAAVQSIAVDAESNVYVGTTPKARVVQISPDGIVRELLKAKGKYAFALLARPDGTVYVATAPGAAVHAIRPDERTAEIYDPETAFVAGMAADDAGSIYLTAADTGRVIKLDAARARTGRYLSATHDAEAVARWGAVRWRGKSPEGAGVSVWARTGATAYPDATWSPWQRVVGDMEGSAALPDNRFAQCRVDLEGARAAPEVETLEFSYLPVNRSPEVKLTSPKGDEIWSGKQRIKWSGRDADRDEIRYALYWSTDRGETWTEIRAGGEREDEGEGEAPLAEAEETTASDGPEGEAEGPGALSSEESGARLRHVLPGRGKLRTYGLPEEEDREETVGGAEEFVFEDDEPGEESALEGESRAAAEPQEARSRATSWEWDTTEVSDGLCWVKVVGSDGRANPLDAREGVAISRSFLVDNTPPELILDRRRTDDSAPPAEISVFERTTYVRSAEFRVDGAEWLAALANDGIFDGRYEAIALDEGRLPEGEHEVEVRARDAAGNVAKATLRYRR